MGFLKNLFGRSESLDGNNNTDSFSADGGNTDFTKVYPRIKGVYDEVENPEPPPKSRNVIDLTHEDSPIIYPLAKGICVCYIEDKGDRYELLQNRILPRDLSVTELHSIAIKNLGNIIAKASDLTGEITGIMMVTNGGNFEAATILVDFFWEELASFYDDDIVIAIPANDLLFIVQKNNHDARKKLKEIVTGFFENPETNGRIVKFIYERVNGKWEFLESA